MSSPPKGKTRKKKQKAPETEEQRKARKELQAQKEEERKKKKEEFTHTLLQVLASMPTIPHATTCSVYTRTKH